MKQKEIYDLMRDCNIKMIQSDKWRPELFLGANLFEAIYFFIDDYRLSAKLFDQFSQIRNVEYVWNNPQKEHDLNIEKKDFLTWIFVAQEIRK